MTYDVTVIRTARQVRHIVVDAKDVCDATVVALEKAYNIDFNGCEKDSDYEVESVVNVTVKP